MRRLKWAAALLLLPCAACADDRTELLKTREAVWRAWFANDVVTLRKLVPPGTIVISAGERRWKTQPEVLAAAAEFQRNGGRLLRVTFPCTEVQRFGDVAILYSEYALAFEIGGKTIQQSGRVTEVFVRRNGRWLNPGWHTDQEK